MAEGIGMRMKPPPGNLLALRRDILSAGELLPLSAHMTAKTLGR
jgi:hypothetical protein